MKRLMFLLFASLLVLSACGNDKKGSETKQETKVNEDKPQFTNDTLVIDDAVLKIKDTFIVNDKDDDKKSIVFKYEVKSKSGRENVAPNTIFMAGFTVLQDTENSIAELDAGTTPNTGKYEEWSKHAYDTIKKGKSAKGIIGYELENDNKVTLKATKGIGGKELGEKEIDLSKLKTVDYSAVDDIVGEFNDSNNQNTTSSNNSASDKKNTQDQVVYKNNDASDEVVDNQKVAQPKTEELPQNGVGGHPSIYDKNIPKPSENNVKTDENGDEYYDATSE
ncbi:TPA: DUF5067 domain-containing protein [Staphylococcus pseudintermedius]|uniref:DUF5067 domain-containing protein n=1 Tax=Staphylococcus pseudintermedius TaxID=283734 RepID=UPI000C1BB1B5|nr:DUF5067 domain-containing protein [Staphylococcus pseudintermedius]EGQ3964499.1 DUF5067 domain-containing protein [Staphylococcus pseudintermedius]EHT8101669.1 DUF5067 domain-containing protein [Staphylococcus pseudintermedius]EII5196949.1 DUF5067 domain-containing protein [Staphylococcus pseudintermedius]EIQ0331690.1 DUF5067 domain-containing protein [Staphylococcus pseudintermedius]EJL1298723.1 DUF5067 domain-containing protein [Staphylococcus pseudintermedius]